MVHAQHIAWYLHSLLLCEEKKYVVTSHRSPLSSSNWTTQALHDLDGSRHGLNWPAAFSACGVRCISLYQRALSRNLPYLSKPAATQLCMYPTVKPLVMRQVYKSRIITHSADSHFAANILLHAWGNPAKYSKRRSQARGRKICNSIIKAAKENRVLEQQLFKDKSSYTHKY